MRWTTPTWRWENKIRLGLIGNLENRRIQDFCLCLARKGHPPPHCISYLEVLNGSSLPQLDLIRLDSPGENAELAQALIRLGGGPENPQLEFGEVAYLAEYHRGYCSLLGRLSAYRGRWMNAPQDIAAMFDKWECHQRFERAGLPRPPSQLASLELLTAPSGRYFFKPLHGSSASGVCALRWTPRRREMFAPLRIAGDRLINSLQVQRYTEEKQIRAILERLIPQGMIAERWIPKLATSLGFSDLRVLVIQGKARQRVLRCSHSPMTNLHLGNRRGQLQEVQAHLPAALELAERALACFPGCLYAGVDILLDQRGRPLIGEINAFGDLLPNLEHQGESAYEAIISAAL